MEEVDIKMNDNDKRRMRICRIKCQKSYNSASTILEKTKATDKFQSSNFIQYEDIEFNLEEQQYHRETYNQNYKTLFHIDGDSDKNLFDDYSMIENNLMKESTNNTIGKMIYNSKLYINKLENDNTEIYDESKRNDSNYLCIFKIINI